MTTTTNHPLLAFGIDPNPKEYDFDAFKNAVFNHITALHAITQDKNIQNIVQQAHLSDWILKINLAFFLAYGSKGIELLEHFCDIFRSNFTIILDGKFNEIKNSLQGYLNFAFRHLKIQGLTINPFLGENTLRMAFEQCVTHMGEKGRIYVLCVTSEGSANTLAYLQENWRNKLLACQQIRDEVFAKQENYKKCAGVVIGANHEKIILSPEVKESQLSVLSPGLGVQGGDFAILKKISPFQNEFTFPLSRSLFDGGEANVTQVKENLLSILNHFGNPYDQN
jgi:orotidine-5'-phosphate decarboxylase